MQTSGSNTRELIVRGFGRAVPFNVRTFRTTGMEFVGRTRLVTRAIVLHTTGAENDADDVYRNMSERLTAQGKPEKLSVHFIIDQRGTIYQTADTEMRAAHCKAMDANSWSIGIELVNRLHNFKAPTKGYLRLRVTDHIHGEELTYDDLYPRQVEQCTRLVRALCELYKLPMRVPEDELGNVRSDVLAEEEAARFTGVVGHLQLEPKKVDPGMRVLRAIQAAGKAPPDVA